MARRKRKKRAARCFANRKGRPYKCSWSKKGKRRRGRRKK